MLLREGFSFCLIHKRVYGLNANGVKSVMMHSRESRGIFGNSTNGVDMRRASHTPSTPARTKLRSRYFSPLTRIARAHSLRPVHQITYSPRYLNYCKRLGREVRQYRKAHGLTLLQLAMLVGRKMKCSPPSLKVIHKLEGGASISLALYRGLREVMGE